MKHITLLFILILLGCNNPSYKYEYKIGECNWHLNDNDKHGLFYKVVKYVDVKNEKYYISEILNFKYDYDVSLYKLQSASYIDDTHARYTHEEKCKRGIRKDLVRKCVKDKNWKFTSKSVKCPSKEEYLKIKKEK